jgi:hypothetical protein
MFTSESDFGLETWEANVAAGYGADAEEGSRGVLTCRSSGFDKMPGLLRRASSKLMGKEWTASTLDEVGSPSSATSVTSESSVFEDGSDDEANMRGTNEVIYGGSTQSSLPSRLQDASQFNSEEDIIDLEHSLLGPCIGPRVVDVEGNVQIFRMTTEHQTRECALVTQEIFELASQPATSDGTESFESHAEGVEVCKIFKSESDFGLDTWEANEAAGQHAGMDVPKYRPDGFDEKPGAWALRRANSKLVDTLGATSLAGAKQGQIFGACFPSVQALTSRGPQIQRRRSCGF